MQLCFGDDALGWDAVQEAKYSGIVMITGYDDRFADMASLSLANKHEYCVHHGYPLVVRYGTFIDVTGANESLHSALDTVGGLIKCGLFHELLRRFPNCSWVFHGDADAVRTCNYGNVACETKLTYSAQGDNKSKYSS